MALPDRVRSADLLLSLADQGLEGSPEVACRGPFRCGASSDIRQRLDPELHRSASSRCRSSGALWRRTHPDLSIESGILQNPAAISVRQGLEKWVYRISDRIVVISDGFKPQPPGEGRPAREADASSRIGSIPTSCGRSPRTILFARRHGLQDKFVVMYSGTISISSDIALGGALEAAETPRSRAPDIRIRDRRRGLEKRGGCKSEPRSSGLERRLFLPFQPYADLPCASWRRPTSSSSPWIRRNPTCPCPPKLYNFMAAGRPDPGPDDTRLRGRGRRRRDADCGAAVAQPDDLRKNRGYAAIRLEATPPSPAWTWVPHARRLRRRQLRQGHGSSMNRTTYFSDSIRNRRTRLRRFLNPTISTKNFCKYLAAARPLGGRSMFPRREPCSLSSRIYRDLVRPYSAGFSRTPRYRPRLVLRHFHGSRCTSSSTGSWPCLIYRAFRGREQTRLESRAGLFCAAGAWRSLTDSLTSSSSALSRIATSSYDRLGSRFVRDVLAALTLAAIRCVPRTPRAPVSARRVLESVFLKRRPYSLSGLDSVFAALAPVSPCSSGFRTGGRSSTPRNGSGRTAASSSALKFRSMIVDAEKGQRTGPGRQHDPRVHADRPDPERDRPWTSFPSSGTSSRAI